MVRPSSGHLIEERTNRGTSYAIRFSSGGRRRYHLIGGAWEGWTRERAEKERHYVMAQVARGEYLSARRESGPPSALPADDEAFQITASLYLARKAARLPGGEAGKTYKALEWALRIAVGHFGHHATGAIDEAMIEDFVTQKLLERRAIDDAREDGHPLLETYERDGKTYQRRRRGLSNDSINKVVRAVRSVLKDAVRRRLIDRNPADDRDLLVRAAAPSRSYLEVVQLAVLLEAADLLERESRGLTWDEAREIRASKAPARSLAREYGVSDTLIGKIRRGELWTSESARARNDVPRRAVIAALALVGPRVSEACLLDGRHMDFARGAIRFPRVTTDASERVVPMVPALRETLLGHRADLMYQSGRPVFATRSGRRNTPDNIRNRILAPAHARANELLRERGLPEIAHLTPHTLRRTFASILAECGVPPRRAMYLLGHTDSSFTMRVYQQVLDMGQGAVELLENVLGQGLEEACSTYSGRRVLPVNCQSPRKTGSSGLEITLQQGSKTGDLQANQRSG
jgi:integrase